MKIVQYALEYHGIDHDQYWSGVSTVFTNWDYVFTGIGDTPHEAGEDAIDMLAQSIDVDNLDTIKNRLHKRADSRDLHFDDCPRSRRYDAECDGCDSLHHYAVLWINVSD